jgi:hypothetical protein
MSKIIMYSKNNIFNIKDQSQPPKKKKETMKH